MTRFMLAYGLTLVAFLAIDIVWIAVVARKFYFERLGHLLMDKPNALAGLGFYAVYVIGIVIFAITPAFKSGSFTTALGYGALFGFFAYATYDMTNYATLKNWPINVVIVDVIWGAALTGTAALIGYLGVRAIMPI